MKHLHLNTAANCSSSGLLALELGQALFLCQLLHENRQCKLFIAHLLTCAEIISKRREVWSET